MTDIEILNFLYELEPESREQDLKITKMMNILIKDRTKLSDSIKDYLDPIAIDEIIDKNITDIYDHYCSWCKDNNYEPESKIALSKAIIYTFKVESTVVTIDGKSKRVFKF